MNYFALYLGTEGVKVGRGAGILPNDCIGKRLTILAIPSHDSFALIGNSDGS